MSTTFRFLLAAVWAAAAVSSLANQDEAARSLLAYRLGSQARIPPLVGGLAVVEIGLVVLLVVGLGTRAAALVSSVLLPVFIGAIASAWARGLHSDCGCLDGAPLPSGLSSVSRSCCGTSPSWP